MRVPKSEPEKFHGDETKFREFLIDFEEYVAKWADNDRDDLYYRDAACVGTCMCTLVTRGGYAEARRLLEMRYGPPYDTSRAYIRKIQAWPEMSMKAADELDRFAILLRDSFNALSGLGRLTELEHPSTMGQMVDKLPDCLKHKWIREDTDIFPKTGYPAKYADLVRFVEGQARVLMNSQYGQEKSRPDSTEGNPSQSGYKGKYGAQNDPVMKTKPVFQVTANTTNDGKMKCCSCCRGQLRRKTCEGLNAL